MDKLPPIPTPAAQRWREFRIQVLPMVMFAGVALSVGLLWRSFVAPTGIVGEVEAIKADVISIHDGTVAQLNIDRFDVVEEGQELGEIVGFSGDFINASVAAIEADLRVMDTRISLDERRNQQSTAQLKMDLYTERVQLVSDKAALIQASNSFKRAEHEFHQTPRLISENDYDIAKAAFDTLQGSVAERSRLIAEMTPALEGMTQSADSENKDVVEDAIKTKIMELEEALKPTRIKAPMSGVVSSIYHRPGEKIVRGVPILTVTAAHSDRIVGYLRQPITSRPTTNDVVIVSKRSQGRPSATGRIIRVGTQMELINPALLSTDSNRIEVGLPILVSVPNGMKLVPGELVDLSIKPAKP